MIKKFKTKAGSASVFKRIAVIAAVLAILCTITAFAAESSSYYVELDDGESKTIIYTSKTSPEKIIEEAEIEFSALDKLDLSGFVPGEDSVIKIKRAPLVGVNDANGTVYFTFDGTVAQAINIADINVGKNDLVNYNTTQNVTDGMIISVARAFPVTVAYHGTRKNIQMAVGTVGDAIKKAGITLSENDVVSHSTDDIVSSGMVIFIDEVVYKEKSKTIEIEFESTTKKDSSLEKGKKKVITEGENGEKTVVYKEKYVNGVLIDSVIKSETVTKQPVNRVTAIGTKKVYTVKANGQPISNAKSVSLDSNGIPKNYTRIVSGSSTAYYGGGMTASGRPAQVGHVAVDPKIIPYGTELYIVATDGTVYGYAIAADTGGFIYDGKTVVDVYLNTFDECSQWGRKNVNIYVLG